MLTLAYPVSMVFDDLLMLLGGGFGPAALKIALDVLGLRSENELRAYHTRYSLFSQVRPCAISYILPQLQCRISCPHLTPVRNTACTSLQWSRQSGAPNGLDNVGCAKPPCAEEDPKAGKLLPTWKRHWSACPASKE